MDYQEQDKLDGILEKSDEMIKDAVEMPNSLRRTIWLVQDEEDNETYTADEILDEQPESIIFDIRQSLYASYKSGEYKYVCKYCQQPLGLKVRTHEGDFFPFFSHFQNSGECSLKNLLEVDPTESVRNREKAFQTSVLYQQMIERLKEVLERTECFTSIEENKVISKPEIKGYRKPAIYSHFNNTEICFDLLVSNPLLSLLVGRNAFYKLHKMFYLWLFPSFTTQYQRLCQKDILYMNRRNVFVFDCKDFYTKENRTFCGKNLNPSTHLYAYEESIRQNKLMLNCYWQTPEVSNVNGKTQISVKWNGPELVAFEDLNFDWENLELYHHDSDVDFYNSYSPEVQRQIDEWLIIKKDRWVKIFDSIEKRKVLYAQLMAKRERKERLKYYYSLIEGDEAEIEVHYDEKSKLYGYSVEDFDIIAPSYYEAKPFFCGFAWVRKKERWGVIDIYNKRIANFQFSKLFELENGLFYAYKNQKYILIDYKGEQKGSLTFDTIEILKDGLYKIGNVVVTGYNRGYWPGSGFYNYKQTTTLWGIINDKGEAILPCRFDSIEAFEDGKAKVKLNNKIGYIDETGHEEYELYEREESIVYRSPLLDKWGLMDKNKNILTPPTYEYISEFLDGLAIVKIHNNGWNGRFGIIDTLGNIVTEKVDFKDVKVFNNGTYAVRKDEEYTISKISDPTFSLEYSNIGKHNDEFIIVSKDEKWGIIDYNGNVIIPFNYGEIVEFDNNIVRVKRRKQDEFVVDIDWNGNENYPIHHIENAWIYESRLNMKYGLMDDAHHPITELIYSRIDHLYGDSFKALKESKWGIIDSEGNVILSFEYDWINHISEGYIKIAKGHTGNLKWGVLNSEGELIVPIDFCEIVQIKNGMIQVKKEKNGKIAELNSQGEEVYGYRKYSDVIVYDSVLLAKSGLMNHEYKPITDLIFDTVLDFKDGKAHAKKKGHWGIINASGETIVPFEYDELIATQNKTFIVKKKREYGIIDSTCNIITPIKYNRIIEKESGLYAVREESYGNWGIINDTNNLIIPIKYDSIGKIENGYVHTKKGRWWKKIKINNTQEPEKIKRPIIDLSKIEDGVAYDAISTGIIKIGVFIQIPNIGNGLIPAKEIFNMNRKLSEFKKGLSFKVQLIKKDIEKNRATFKLIEQ